MEQTCPICNKKFKVFPSQIKQGRGKHCSRRCRGLSERNQANPHWKGGETIQRGYVLVRKPSHPFANKTGYVKRTRLAIEEHLKIHDSSSHYLVEHLGAKYLSPNCKVLHKDGRRNNDDINNLEIQWIQLPKNTKLKTSGSLSL